MNVIRPKRISTKVGLSLATIWRMEKAGTFPKRRQISAGTVGWLEDEVDEWLKNLKAA